MAAKIRVLVVDDSDYSRHVLVKTLQDHDVEIVGSTPDWQEALSVYEKKKPDVVTFDLIMPNGGGVEGIKELLTRDPRARVIVISAVRTGPEMEAAKSLGIFAYVSKPVRWEELGEALAKATA
jgi:DNA-binding NarL/FixJ family response regulator